LEALIENLISSNFSICSSQIERERERERESKVLCGHGIPIGNLTSQLFANIYMNEFDKFVKHQLKVKYYIRFADDFVILSHNRNVLENYLPKIESFLSNRLKLKIHPQKLLIKTFASGIDFLGWVHFSDHRILRTKTKHRMLKKLQSNPAQETIASYFGLISHGNTNKIKKEFFSNKQSSQP
jgi:hypothetical protein